MPLKDRIQDDMKAAMRARDRERLGTIRLVLAAIKQREVDERTSLLDDAQVIATLDRMVKQRRESVAQYRQGGREDLAARESAEIEVIQAYLPRPLSDADLGALIEEAVGETGATSQRDMGKVMGWLKPRIQGRADMAQVSTRVRSRLAG